ncbi:HNH endonuclease [Chryseobacterium sp. MEBOG06]|nr:RHS repeat-associated core domain-containing protein [Chryseobacterium sp. MEBOG06]UKB86419.1 HNH endonuclease [Chryseobacterium sp. MEBOG06]
MSQNYRYSTQGQEKQEDTKWSSFKWRNYDPTIGRFFNIDPLSEKYAYQSHYNFSENRVVDGRELEGLEWVSTKIFRVAPPAAAAGSTVYGAGVAEEAKTNAINNYNGISKIVNSNINITIIALKAISTIGITVANRVLHSEGENKKSSKPDSGKTEGNEAGDKEGLGKIQKPGTGKGTVAKEDRDAKRTLSKKEKTELIEEKDNKCEGCNKEVTPETSNAHHTIRHADGGETTKENTNILCKDCHKEIHKP